MKKITKSILAAALLLITSQTKAQTLIHYWNFNDATSVQTITTPNTSLVPTASISYTLATTTELAYNAGTGQDFNLSNLNARNSDVSGTHLRFNNPIGGTLTFNVPTTGYENPIVKFTTRRSGSGAGTQTWSYSTDGVTYTTFQTINPVDGAPTLQTLDFSAITAADNNANFKIKVEFSQGTGGTVGNNRFDNFTVEGYTPGTTPVATPKVSLAKNFLVVNEDAGTVTLNLNVQNAATSTVDLVVKPAPFSTANANDFTLQTQTLTIDATTGNTKSITIPIIDDTNQEQQAEYFVLSLENANGLTLEGNTYVTIYIKDNDRLAPVPSNEITLDYVGSFDPSGTNSSSTEIVVHDPQTQRLFTTSAIAGFLDIVDFSNPLAPTTITSINMAPYGGITSVAVKNGIVAVASPNAIETNNGSVVFFDTNGVYKAQVTVGALPDNIVFSKDGTKVLTANEGQPNSDYSVDPEGSVSIIDVSGGLNAILQTNVTTLGFTAFNNQEAHLIQQGVRKTKSSSTLSQDFEPEYITVSNDSQKAWVTLQENNAIAEINLANKTITSVWALGTKDMSIPGNGFDASDNNGEILIANWPVEAYYIPDAVAHYQANGVNYLITANEGDEKEYDNLEERVAVNATTYVLEPLLFPNSDVLKQAHNLGRFRATNLNGDLNNNGAFEKIRAVGTRSFSIFNADTKALVYDSGDDFEMYTAKNFPTIFNADHESNTPKARSRAKGPEPEGVTTAIIGNQTFAFIALERIGGVMVYNVTDPNNVTFVDYKNNRSTSAYTGDFGAESIIYVAPQDAPNNKGYIIVANEISGTLTTYEVNTTNLSEPEFEPNEVKTFNVFPNPTNGELVYFNREADVTVYDLNGRIMHQAKKAQTLNVASYPAGIYIIKTSEGLVQKLVKK
ncbi:T9SS type A sorting domain-containing protein [Flavobacterium sp. xlx-214]|uniref:choice-of-anchor I family protein n=1 Tax=unclassified Flavobacterium TaxID=196869 RepID=UPI0013CF459C|nr:MULTISPECIES: choice-of-anchor I family protein [unclassified Flavobacterium]MBA5792858.1 T9SS type A sorting domain-containing protein [Flavobacterium sp. xlx-221]QMI84807.1 T9SS type A sorting domain-containing protein [Flavobacterium sp. xlx-214]